MTTVSLFCGAGGESAGKQAAMEALGITAEVSHAVNHWQLAVQVHGRNFPTVEVHQEDITQVTAADFGLERISLLWASPSCVHHSRARGGLPKSDQQRSHAGEVLDRWIKVAKVDVLLVENVPEFAEWGPLDESGQPIKERKGEQFREFVGELKDLGYQVEWRILCAADFGDPTTRRRFFLQAVKDGYPITWPEPTHRDPKKPVGLFDPELPPWRTAAECIDWSIPCPSIFDRKRPLAEATMRRIAAGIVKYVLNGKPYIVGVGGRQGQARTRGMDEPMGTTTTKADAALVVPSLIHYHSTMGDGPERVSGLEAPIPTLDTSNRFGLVSAFLANLTHGVRIEGLEEPIKTITTAHRGEKALVAASLVQTGYGERIGQAPRAMDIQAPLGTVVAGGQKHALVAAFLTQYYGTINVSPMSDPLDTVTTKDRHGLVTVQIDGETYAIVDIGLRMLEPHELAKAMGFPEWYRFERRDGGNLTKADKVKMIGNACPVGTVAALIRNVLAPRVGSYRRTA